MTTPSRFSAPSEEDSYKTLMALLCHNLFYRQALCQIAIFTDGRNRLRGPRRRLSLVENEPPLHQWPCRHVKNVTGSKIRAVVLIRHRFAPSAAPTKKACLLTAGVKVRVLRGESKLLVRNCCTQGFTQNAGRESVRRFALSRVPQRLLAIADFCPAISVRQLIFGVRTQP